jgi:hypothetical protein
MRMGRDCAYHAAADHKAGCLSGPSRFFLYHAADILCIVISL